ncbi:MAG: hypothetical protein R2873_26555 [Caldilineaceae bacterium]|nr:hypothetical protein [Caldilineaceae bacterium]
MNNLLLILRSVIVQEPLCLIWLAGLLMAWIQRYENGKLSLVVALSMLLFLVSAIGGVYFHNWMPVSVYDRMNSLPVWLNGMLTFNQPTQLIIETIAWSLLLFGMFNWRTTRWQ